MMTVGQFKKFLDGFDSDSQVHFFLNSEKISLWEMWAADLGPMISFRTKDELPIKMVPVFEDAFVDPDDVA